LNGAAGPESLILVAGTASIRGEETVHVGDVRGQTRETFENLAVLVGSASGVLAPAPAGAPRAPGAERPKASAPGSLEALRQFRDLRVYYVRPGDRAVVAGMVAAAAPHLKDVEYVRADLCRPDLLVEIEGTACLSAAPFPARPHSGDLS
jgi:chorismate lyase/3-hydroxybenzoate synthase